MFQKVLSYVNQHGMLVPGEGIVAGVSGGADSVCLLFVLHKIQESTGGKLYAAHVNHGLRGEEADRDQEFVRRLCMEWRIPFYLKSVDLREIARQKKLSEEEAGRLVRYEFFNQVAEETGAVKIAVGHNANDNAETLLFHLIRGSGLKGLSGISPVQGKIIRPLLCVKRKEIEGFVKESGLDFCMDTTNLEDTYTRNRIRHKLLPLMEEINPEAVEAVGRAAAACREAVDFLEMEGESAFLKFVEGDEETGWRRMQKEAFETLPSPVVNEMLLRTLAAISGSRKDIGEVHIGALRALQAGETGKRRNLPYGIEAENQYGAVFLRKKTGAKQREKEAEAGERTGQRGNNNPEQAVALVLPEENYIEGKIILPDGAYIQYSTENYEKNMKIPKNRYTKWLDCDIIKNTLHFRNRRKGDWIQIFASGGRKKLKDYFIDEKIPRQERDRLILLADGDEILWIPGYRLSEKVKVKETTKQVLKITYIGGNADGA